MRIFQFLSNESSMGGKHSKKKSKTLGTLNVLTLGTSGSGKSTFAKQMKYIHQGFSKEELAYYKSVVYQNITTGLQELIINSAKYETAVVGPNRKHARYFAEQVSYETPWDPSIAVKARALWDDPAIQDIRTEIRPLSPNLDYFMNSLDRIVADNYLPSKDDILMARLRTTGLQVTSLVKDKYLWNVMDVGGHKPERSKWEAIIQENNISALIYMVALDEYNIPSTEVSGKSKMDVARDIFEELVQTLKGVSLVLFLNKLDLFEKKVANKKEFAEFKRVFPRYEGGQSVDECSRHIKKSFIAIADEEGVEVHTHNTCAIDTEAMSAIFDGLTKDVYAQRLASNRPNII